MNFRTKNVILLGLLLAIVPVRGEKNGTVPWALLPKAAGLSEGQKSVLAGVLTKTFNYGTCPDTVLNCLNQTPPDPIALRLSNFCAYLASKDLPAKDLEGFVQERARFANPAKVYDIKLEGRPIYGNPVAPLTIVEFGEFKCPYCQQHAPTLKKLVDESNGQVRHIFKYFPIKTHKGTVLSAKAAEAAHRQGHFWEMYTLLYQDREHQEMKDLLKYAAEIGLDQDRFKVDLEDEALVTIIENEKIEGLKAGVTSTPTLYINGKRYTLRLDEAFLKDILNEEASRLGKPLPYEGW